MWGLSSPHGAPFPRSLCFPAGLKTWLGKSKKHKKTEAFYRLWFAHPLIGFVATWEFKKQTNLSQNHCNKVSIFTFFHLKFIIRKRKCGYAYTESCVEKTNFGSTNLQIRKHQPTKAQPNPSVGDRDVHLWITALAELHCSSLVCEWTMAILLTNLYGGTTHAKYQMHFKRWTASLNKWCETASTMQKSPALSFQCIWGPGGAPALPHHTAP